MAYSEHTDTVWSPPLLKTAGKAVWKPPLWSLEGTVTFQQALYEKLPLKRGEEKQGRGPDVEWGRQDEEHQGLVFKASGESSETSFARIVFLPTLRPYLLYIPFLPVILLRFRNGILQFSTATKIMQDFPFPLQLQEQMQDHRMR